MADGVLSKIYSASDALKRRMKDLVSNPVGYTQQVADYVKGNLLDPEKATQMVTESMNPAPISGGALGMLVGMRGAHNLGEARISEWLSKEFEAANKRKSMGVDQRMRANAGHPSVHTSYEGRPFYEIDDAGLVPRRHQEFDKEVPLLDSWVLPTRFHNAYIDDLSGVRLLNSLSDPLGTGSYNSADRLVTIGFGPTRNAQYNEMVKKYPQIAHAKIKETMAHELGGHFMQDIEKITGGTSPESMVQRLRDKPEPQLEKHLIKSGILDLLGQGKSPDVVFDLYSKELTNPGALRQLQSYVQAAKEGRLEPQDALDQSLFHQSTATNLMDRLNKRETLQDLLNRGFMDRLPPEIRSSATAYGAGNPMHGVSADEIANAYGLYRTNAGEDMAEAIGQRTHLTPAERRENPFYQETEVPLDLLHTVR